MAAELKTPPPSLKIAFTQQDTVTLLVGFDEEPLVAHESYLTRNSEFFKAAMKKEWAEGQIRVIKLPEDDLATMVDYLAFTYSRDLPTLHLTGSPMVDGWTRLAKLYLLGERILDKCIRNAVVSEFLRITTTPNEKGDTYFMPTVVSDMIFDGTPEGSPIRQMIVDNYVSWGYTNWLDTGTDHPALILELARALLEKVTCHHSCQEFRHRKIKADDYFV